MTFVTFSFRTILFVLIFITLNCFSARCQKVYSKETKQSGTINLSTRVQIPKINNGYTIWLPETEKIKGLIVFIHPRRDTVNTDKLIDYALQKDLAVIYTSTNNRLEFFFEENKMEEVLSYIQAAIDQFNIPKQNILYCGMSLEGTRVLKLAMHVKSGKSEYNILPKGIVVCDSPLDMYRFYHACQKAEELKFHPVAANEGEWVSGYLTKNLGEDPETSKAEYIRYSPFSAHQTNGGNAKYFAEIPIRAYTEPDINWWLENRGQDYYGMNAIDMAGFINQLKLQGNKLAQLVVTENKGVLPNGSRHPHSWSIVDEKEMIRWFISLNY